MRSLRMDKRLMACTAAAMYGAAALDGLIEGLLPRDPSFALAPVLAVIATCTFLLIAGPRLPRWALALLGPLGVALTAIALAATPAAGDGAVLYTLPALWMTFFFGRRGAAAIIACVGLAHALVLVSLPAASAFPARWVDVMTGVSLVALVALALMHRNESLVAQLAAESRTDALTGLLNRRGFDERAALALAHTQASRRIAGVRHVRPGLLQARQRRVGSRDGRPRARTNGRRDQRARARGPTSLRA